MVLVAGVHPVLKLDEDTGDDVLHQRLGAERNSQPQGTGTCQQRCDIHADFREHDHNGDGTDNHRQRVAKQGQQRAGASAWQGPAVNIRNQTVFNQARQQRPSHSREEQNQRNADQNIDGLFPAPLCSQFQKSNNPGRSGAT